MTTQQVGAVCWSQLDMQVCNVSARQCRHRSHSIPTVIDVTDVTQHPL